MANHGLPSLPSLPSSARSRDLKPCECGCSGLTQRRFVPGHDSILKAWRIRVERDVVKLEDIPHDGLRAAVARELGLAKPLTKAELKARKKAEAEAKAREIAEMPIKNVG